MYAIQVHKLSSVCLTDADAIRRLVGLVSAACAKCRAVVVTSALAGVTGELRTAALLAAMGDREGPLATLARLSGRHARTLAAFAQGDAAAEQLRSIASELESLLRGAALLGEMTPRTLDRVLSAGVRMSSRIVACAFAEGGLRAVPLDADQFLETDGRFGGARVLADVASRTVSSRLLAHLDAGEIPVVTGHVGRAPDGATTTLGSGGGELTATLVAQALGADEVSIWTDHAGIFTADREIVSEARPIEQLNYREAAELSYYRGEALHLRSMAPILDERIPIRVRSAVAPDEPGTVVDGRFRVGSHPVKGVAAARGQCLVSVEGRGSELSPRLSARALGALAEAGVRVTMLCQAGAESSVCAAVPDEHVAHAETVLKREFREELTTGEVDDVAVTRGIALVAIVGLGIRHTPGVASRLFAALGRRRINVIACSQGSSQFNVTVALDGERVEEAIRAIHQEFGLHRLDTGADSATALDLVIVGTSKIARALLEMVGQRAASLRERVSLEPRVVAIIDEGGRYLLDPRGLASELAARALTEAGEDGRLPSFPDVGSAGDALAALSRVFSYRLVRPVVLDASLPPVPTEVLVAALRLGADLITANKQRFAGPLEDYVAITGVAREGDRFLGMEATLGAALPVFDTIERLLAAGDRITRIRAALSGTVGYVLQRVGEGCPFSKAVAEANEYGFTEADPLEDVSGLDCLQKSIIVGRTARLLTDESVPLVGLTGLAPGSVTPHSVEKALEPDNDRVRQLVETARSQGAELRFVATISPGRLHIEFETVAPDTTLGLLRGTDKTVLIETDRYCLGPLVLSGPGVGADVAAVGMLNDLLHVAALRR